MATIEEIVKSLVDAIKGVPTDEVKKEEKKSQEDKQDVEEKVVKEKEPEIDPRDTKISELEKLISERDKQITEHLGTINALKELTKTDGPGNSELSLQELIEKGEL